MGNQTNCYNKIEIWISTHLSTFELEFRNFLSTPRLSQKKGVLIKKKLCRKSKYGKVTLHHYNFSSTYAIFHILLLNRVRRVDISTPRGETLMFKPLRKEY